MQLCRAKIPFQQMFFNLVLDWIMDNPNIVADWWTCSEEKRKYASPRCFVSIFKAHNQIYVLCHSHLVWLEVFCHIPILRSE